MVMNRKMYVFVSIEIFRILLTKSLGNIQSFGDFWKHQQENSMVISGRLSRV